jgi:NTE family protein
MVGALQALEEQVGFRAQDATRILGTSAGALVGALGAAGVSSRDMADYAAGSAGHLVGEAAGPYNFTFWPPPLGFGSARMAAAMLRQQRDRSLGAMLMGLLPRGVVNTDPIHKLVDSVAGSTWPDSPSLRVVACNYASGQRVTFGSAWAPVTSVGAAVAASCAIPAFFRPVQIGDQTYIDGGIHSHSNLDLIATEKLDLVICLSPMSSGASTTATTMLERIAAARRRRASAALSSEARVLHSQGTQLVVLEPEIEDLAAMGANPMARDRAERVIATARNSAARAIRRLALPAQFAAAAAG